MRLSPGLAFALCVAIWGGSWIAIRAAVEGADPIGVAALRTTCAVLVLALLALATRLPFPEVRSALGGMGVGLVLMGANFALVYWGAARVPSGLAALLYATTPLQAALFAGLLRIDALRWRVVLGASMGFAAVAVAFLDVRSVDALSVAGVLAILLGATASAVGSLMARKTRDLHPVWLNILANASASVMLWACYVFAGTAGFLPRGADAWIGFAYMLMGGSVVAFLAYFQLDAARASFATLTTPFVALAIGAVAFHERVRPGEIAGGLVLLAAGYLAMRSPSAAAAKATSATRNLPSEK